jgi:hypothetical protein
MAFKPKEIVVPSVEEFQEMIDNKDFIIAESIVTGILANLEGTKKNIHLLSVVCQDENTAYDITVERQHFATTLEENLPHYIREEKYEDCQVIADTITKLKGGTISDILNQLK